MTSPEERTCSIEGCPALVFSRGWCTKHYTRWQRHGDPLRTTRTPPATANATEKHCPRCGNIKPMDAFDLRPNGKPKGYCRDCMRRYDADYAQTEDGREKRRVARSRWNDSNHEYFLQYRYGITRATYDQMLAEQGGGCAICGTTKPSKRSDVFSVDHCHNTNKVRGLLCGHCNRGLGQFGDNPDRLRAAVAYLERHR